MSAAREGRKVWGFCLHCGHAARLDPFQVANRAGRDMTLGEVGARLRCQRCGRRGGMAALDPAKYRADGSR